MLYSEWDVVMMEALYRGKKLKERVVKVSLYTHDGGP